MIAFFIIGLLVLLILGLPVAFSLGSVAAAGMLIFEGSNALNQLPLIAYKSLNDFVLSSLPLYILMSQILLKAGVGKDLYEVASKWLRHLPGGLGIATIVTCTIFSAISGSSVATAATVGMIAIPEMTRRGYDKKTVLGLLAGGGTLGILIPPSVPMIIYGSVTDESIGKLFIAGIVPGLLLSLLFMIYASLIGRKFREEPAPMAERWEATRKSFWGMMLPVLILGGIYSGIVTPTEAAAVGVVFSLFLGLVVYRTIDFKALKYILLSTVKSNAMVLMIMVGAMMYGHILTGLRIPHMLTNWALGLSVSPWTVIIIINLILLALGFFLETISIILITTPIFYPIILQLGFDPIWFGILLVVNMELALITPPVGMNLFVLKGLDQTSSMNTIIRGALPYVGIMLVFIILLAVFPELATWLPSHLK